MSQGLAAYLTVNRQRFLDELFQFLRIPSISTLPEYRGEVERAARYVAEALGAAGLENVAVLATGGHPLVYADWLHAPGRPTVLCYGHYDVQPPDPLDEWVTPPFEPAVRHGNIYARGASDDKGQMFMHIKAVEALRAAGGGRLPVNVKFLIEGEEESGGAALTRHVAAQAAALRADVALVSDTELYAPGLPTLCLGLRGLVYAEVEARGAAHDLHSGVYGGAAPNAVYGLIELLAQAKDAGGRILVPGIYDDVAEPSAAELDSWRRLPFDEQKFLREEVGAAQLTGERDRLVFERLWSRPTFEVHGVAGGFTGAGSKTVIPAAALAKVSLRLVPNQDPARIVRCLEQWVAARAPAGIRTGVRVLASSPAVVVDPGHPAIRMAARALTDVFGQPTVFIRSGGSIPVVGDFARHLGIPSVLMGFGLPDDALHAPNEKFCLENFYTGIRTVAHFLQLYGGHT